MRLPQGCDAGVKDWVSLGFQGRERFGVKITSQQCEGSLFWNWDQTHGDYLYILLLKSAKSAYKDSYTLGDKMKQ